MNTFVIKNWANWERFITWVDSTNTNKADPERDLAEPIEYAVNKAPSDMTGVTTRIDGDQMYATFTKDTAAYRLQKFTSEFEQHLNLEYCAVYFVMTELLLCYDSRGKNLMMASYGPMREGGDYIWFPIFYDIDTQLGLNNIGSTLCDYDTDATLEQTFSSPASVLWVNFWTCFPDYIKNKYITLRSSSRLTYENINGAYLCNPEIFDSKAMAGIRPLIAIGLDEYYKYVAPSKTGYYDTSGDVQYDNNSYAYAINGDRKLSRELLLRNRMNYIDSCWIAGDYTPRVLEHKAIILRGNANNIATSDKYLDSNSLSALPSNAWSGEELGAYPIPYLDGTPEFEVTPFLKQYVVAYNDNQINGAPVKYQGAPIKAYVSDSVLDGYKTTPGYPEQIIRLPGPDYISELGDLSTKYLSRLTIPQAKRLLYLDVGSDAPGYFNGLLGATTEGSGAGMFNINDGATITDETSGKTIPNPNRKALLRRINLTQITELSEALDVSGSDKLRELRILGTKIPYVLFAEGAPLDTIHLPKTITRIDLTEARDLKRILTTKPVVFEQERDTYTGLYIEGITDLNDQTNAAETLLSRINIKGGVLGYDSYILMMNTIELRDRENKTKEVRLNLNLEDIQWSPYTVVEYGSAYNPLITYYRLTDHSTFVRYNFESAEEWNNLTLNEKIFTYEENEKSNLITSLSFLDKFIIDHNRVITSTIPGDVSYYSNLQDSIGYPNITGSIYVSNADGVAIKEADITEKYGKIWEKLKIYAANVEEAYIAKFIQKLDNGRDKEIETIRYNKTNEVHPTVTQKIVTKQNYVFRGWTLDPTKVEISDNEVESLINAGILYPKENYSQLTALTFSEENDVFTFYAVFSRTSFTINFLNSDESEIIPTQQVYFGDFLTEPSIVAISPQEKDLQPTQRYKHLGWVNNKEDCYPRSINSAKLVKNIDKIISQNTDRTFYACYIQEDCLTNETDSKYFNFTEDAEGVIISVKSEYRFTLSGKITIPSFYNNKPITRIENGFLGSDNGSSQANQKVTHLFFKKDSQLTDIGASAFQNVQQLAYAELPESLERLGTRAFNTNTTGSRLIIEDILKLKNLEEIGAYCFAGIKRIGLFEGDSLNVRIPGSVEAIGERAFANINTVPINILQFGDVEDPVRSNLRIGDSAFRHNSNNETGCYNDVYFYYTGGIPAVFSDENIQNNLTKVRNNNQETIPLKDSGTYHPVIITA